MSRSLLQRSLTTRFSTTTAAPAAPAPLRCTTSLLTTRARHSSDSSSLQTELPARKIPLVYDYLVPTPSHLLNICLADVFASSATGEASTTPRILPGITSPTTLPPSQHLIYFPPAIPGRDLLPDGTDPLQSPGGPFVRRMWAGGAVRWNNSPAAQRALALDGARVACVESIKDVAVKGKPGDEKVFVGIERRVGRCSEDNEGEDSIRARLGAGADEADFHEASIVERRNIVFMRERSKEQAVADMEKAKSKILRPPAEGAQIEHSFVPDPKLLFRYSALTYNAHAIHLDSHYCREVEGHRDLLFHGPLSFTMLMMLLRVHLAKTSGNRVGVKSVEYRNLAPLYCNETLKLAGREKEKGKWEMWAETPEGGVAVKGTVVTEPVEDAKYGDLAMLGL